MDRRKFLKILGVGVTIPLVPKLVLGGLREDIKNNGTHDNRVDLAGGYDKYNSFYWVRTTTRFEGMEWHNVVQFTSRKNYSIIAETINNVHRMNGIPAMVNEKQIREAFENHS